MKKYFLIPACILLVSCSARDPSPAIGNDRGYKKQIERHSDMTCEEIRKEGLGLSICFRPKKTNEHQIEKYEDATCIGIRVRDSEGKIVAENKNCK